MLVGVQKAMQVASQWPLRYRGQPTIMSVKTPIEHLSLSIEAYIRGLAVENDVLPALWCDV